MPGLDRRRQPRSVRIMAVAFCAGLAVAPDIARAAEPASPGSVSIDLSWATQPVSMVTNAAKSVGAGAGSVWTAVVGFVMPSQPFDALPDRLSDDDRMFFAVLDAIGLQLSEVRVGGTWISSASYRLVAAREPSDGDVERAERQLDDYRNASYGLRARAKQRIVRSVLDLAAGKRFLLTGVVIDLSPWPSVSYEMTARNRPPEPAERRIIDSLQAQ